MPMRKKATQTPTVKQKKTITPAAKAAAGRKALAMVAKPKSTPAKPTTKFMLYAPDAKQVSLCGEFNAWEPGVTPMKLGINGLWEAALILEPGRYQYKFVADGQWLADPNAPTTPNEFGSVNSVIEVKN